MKNTSITPIWAHCTMYFTSYHISRQSKTDSLWFTLRFCFPASWRKLSENHTPFCAKHLRVWESEIVWLEFESDFCLTWSIDLILLLSVSNFSSQEKLSEKHMPLCVKHLRVWESESVWLKYESDFCLSWSIAPILSSSVSNFSSWQKLSEKHTPWCAKHLRVWESEIV